MTYNQVPVVEKEEKYDVSSGIRRSGPYVLDTTNLGLDSYIPSFTPIFADLTKKTAKIVRNVKVVSNVSATDTVIKVAKGSLFVTGMFIGNGTKGGKVISVDITNGDYDSITVETTIGVAITSGTVLFEADAADGKNQKYVANSALYGRWQVVNGINIISLLRTAAEIEPSNLTIPFSANDKDALKGWFQFNE